MAKRNLTKAQRLAVLKKLGDDYGLRDNETEESVTRCEGCGAIFRPGIQTALSGFHFLLASLTKSAAPARLLCLNCKAYEYATRENLDGEEEELP